MSTENEFGDLVSQFRDSQAYNYAIYAGTVFLFHDWVLTFPSEIQYIWKPRKTLVFWCFCAIRYGSLFTTSIYSLAVVLPWDFNGCYAIQRLSCLTYPVGAIGVFAIFVLRSYAVWNRSKLVAILLSTIATASIVLRMLCDFTLAISVETGVLGRLASCTIRRTVKSEKFDTATKASVAMFDTAVLLLLLIKSLQQCMGARKLGLGQGYTYLLLRSGLIYYITIEILVVAGIVSYYTAMPPIVSNLIGNLQAPLASVLTQRFTLSLRQLSEKENTPSKMAAQIDGMNFAWGTVIGKIGAPVGTNDAQEDARDEGGQRDVSGIEEAVGVEDLEVTTVLR